MSYHYDAFRGALFTDEGQRAVLDLCDFCRVQLARGGAVRAQELIANVLHFSDSWQKMSVVDRLVELGILREVTLQSEPAWQGRVFVSGRSS